MARIVLASWLSLFLFAVPTFAADVTDTTNDPIVATGVASTTSLSAALASMTATPVTAMATPAPAVVTDWKGNRRPSILPALYVGSALLQGYDAYSTLTAIKHGAVEANPLMKSVTGNPVAFIGLKAAVATTSIMAAERMWKNHNRVGAIVVMAASNGLMAMVAAHNASVISNLR